MRNLFFIFYIVLIISACFAHANDIEKSSYEEHLLKAQEYNKVGNLDEAINEYKKAINLNPSSEDAHYELALTYYRKWHISFEDAQRKRIYNTKSRRIVEYSKEKLEREYEFYGERKELKQLSMKEFEETLKYNPDNWMARYHIATNYLNEGHYDDAIREYKLVIKTNPDYVNSYGLMAKAYFQKGLYKLAIEKYKEAIDLEPNSEIDHHDLGLAYLKIGKKQEALKELEELKRLDSTFYERLREKIGEKEK